MNALVASAVLFLLLRSWPRSADGGPADVSIGRGVDVLHRFGVIGDIVFGGGSDDVAAAVKPSATRIRDIFKDPDSFAEVVNVTKNHANLLNVTFCPDLDCLFDVYFDGFRVDLSDQPWKLLTSSRQQYFVSERFGLPEMALNSEQKFVIMSYRRPVKRIKTTGNFLQLVELKSAFVDKIMCTSIGIESMVTDFVAEFGSHYIDEYIVGDSIFQVYVYLPVLYKMFYEKCMVNNCSDALMNRYLSKYSEYRGQVVQIGSGGEPLNKWMNDKLQKQSLRSPYVSLYALKDLLDPYEEINALMDDRALVGLHLKTVSTLIADPAKKQWFSEVLDNHLKLREVNL